MSDVPMPSIPDYVRDEVQTCRQCGGPAVPIRVNGRCSACHAAASAPEPGPSGIPDGRTRPESDPGVPPETPWVSVRDRLPEILPGRNSSRSLLYAAGGRAFVGRYLRTGWFFQFEPRYEADDPVMNPGPMATYQADSPNTPAVTHWRYPAE